MGGLPDLVCGYYLSKDYSVAIIERDKICGSTSGKSTGKVTSQHGLFYKYLVESNGADFAKKYMRASEQAINNIESIINNENIQCDFERISAYIYTTKDKEVNKIKEEEKIAKKLEIVDTEFVTSVELPVDCKGAIKFNNQAKFNPVKYAQGLCNAILRENGNIFEKSKATSINRIDDRYEVYVNRNKVKADYVIIATRYPIISSPGFYFLKMYQSTSYAIVADVKGNLFDGIYISSETPTTSFSTIKDNSGRKMLLAVGYDYKTGVEDLRDGYLRLETEIRKMYPEAEIIDKWSAEDCITLDKIPYIGQFSNMMPNVFVATGFNKWGNTTSNIAANIIKDLIKNKENEYMEIFKSTRFEPIKNRQELGSMIKEANESILLSKFKIPNSELESVKVNEGKIIKMNDKKVGVYKDEKEKIYVVNPVCTHLGCELYFNNADKTWECPCHGSKFSYKGEVLEVPANKNLKT